MHPQTERVGLPTFHLLRATIRHVIVTGLATLGAVGGLAAVTVALIRTTKDLSPPSGAMHSTDKGYINIVRL
jgi:hypothetical protein